MMAQKLGILLVNLGTPEAPTPKAIRAFLRPFLSDHRVIDFKRWLWLPALYGFILPRRPHKIRPLYDNIWTKEGSPLRVISEKQAKALQAYLDHEDRNSLVKVGMVYGKPSFNNALDELLAENISKLIILPLFPQYSSTTTAAGVDAFARSIYHQKGLPPFELIHHYHDHPAYIKALADSINLEKDETLLFSFHGIPARYEKEGDYYPDHCWQTARLVAQHLGLSGSQWLLSYQSRFGREEWLKPYTDETIASLPQRGIQKLAVICPGFAADCLETLEEIAITNRNLFLQAGGKHFRYIPALNTSEAHIALLADLIKKKI
ncbi:ferrochelatase [Streptococcus macacae]|nr:ferrochelatase [Streptococcus macacae]